MNFNQIPSNIRSPLTYIEVNASNQNINSPTNKRILVLGQRLTTGTVAANVPTLISNYSQAVQSFGQGSMLANMFKVLFDNNNSTEKWCCASDDDGAGTAASGTLTVTGTATAAGTISLYLGGVLVSVAVADNDDATAIGDSIVAAITANADLPVTAVNVTGTVTVTYRHKGTVGNYYDMRLNYAGANAGEVLPAGVSIAIVQLTGGATDPTLTSTIAALPEQIFDYWVCPFQGSTPLTALDTEMDSRWNALRMLEGHVFAAAGGSVATLVTLGTSRNNPHMSILDAGNGSPSPSYLWAAAAAGVIATSASIDPARPFTTLPLEGILPESVQNRRLLSDRNTLLYDGISTHTVAQDGTVLLERMITCYQTNAFCVSDGVYLDLTTPLTLAFLRQDLRARITTKFARMKIADDGTRYGAGQAIVTPSIIKSEIIAWANQMSLAGLVEDMEDFKANLIVERDANDPTRVNVQLTPNLVNPLYIVAANISFVL
jgi:phage tail sheath gpL-like